MLNQQQSKATELLSSYLLGESSFPFVLGGYAGTGKTFILKNLLEELVEQQLSKETILMCTPTHESMKVLKQRMHGVRNVAFMTIHAALKIKPKILANGKQVFEQDKSMFDEPEMSRANYIIIDESSMIDDDLFNIIQDTRPEGSKIIFVGDPAQLPPVAHPAGKKAIPFREWKKRGFGIATLTEIVRQKTGSEGIVELSMYYRKREDPPDELLSGAGIEVVSREEALKIAVRRFQHEDYLTDKNLLRVLSYTNANTDRWNNTIHEKLYGHSELQVGETIILQEPAKVRYQVLVREGYDTVVRYKAVTANNGDKFTITKILGINQKPMIVSDNITGTTEVYTVEATNELSHVCRLELAYDVKLHRAELDQMATSIRNSKGGFATKVYWKKWYEIREQIGIWKHAYASTIHKAQGSTMETVILDIDDIEMARKMASDFWELMYTAVTRPSHKLIIII